MDQHHAYDSDISNDFVHCIDLNVVEELSSVIDRIHLDGSCTVDFINDITVKTGKVLTDAADKCKLFKVVKKRYVHKKKNKSWFDAECKTKQTEYYSSRQRYRHFRSYDNLQSLKNQSKTYKRVLNLKFKHYHDSIAKKLRLLKNTNPKEYWCILNKYSGERKEVLNRVSLEVFYEHFCNLNDDDSDDAFDMNSLNF